VLGGLDGFEQRLRIDLYHTVLASARGCRIGAGRSVDRDASASDCCKFESIEEFKKSVAEIVK
jgi:hypothetical protein